MDLPTVFCKPVYGVTVMSSHLKCSQWIQVKMWQNEWGIIGLFSFLERVSFTGYKDAIEANLAEFLRFFTRFSPCGLICLGSLNHIFHSSPQGSPFTAFILLSQTRCKWWDTLFDVYDFPSPPSLSLRLCIRAAELTRGTSPHVPHLFQTHWRCVRAAAQNPTGSCCHIFHFIKPWISLCMELLWLLVRSSWSQRQRESWTCMWGWPQREILKQLTACLDLQRRLHIIL